MIGQIAIAWYARMDTVRKMEFVKKYQNNLKNAISD